MKISLFDPVNNKLISEGEKFIVDAAVYSGGSCGRRCYSPKPLEEILRDPERIARVAVLTSESGHHSVFGHAHLSLDIEGIPKIVAMFLNNQRYCNTSERSARYTRQEELPANENRLYKKWNEILFPEIYERLPERKDMDTQKIAEKLAMENARYMISVFTPTSMIYTLSLRNLVGLRNHLKNFGGIDELDRRMKPYLDEFVELTRWVENEITLKMDPKPGEGLNWRGRPVEEHWGDTFSTNVTLSYAALAQLHRHRVLRIQLLGDEENYFIPEIVREIKRDGEWFEDISSVKFPQGQNVRVSVRGNREDLVGLAAERLCGHAQFETMRVVRDQIVEPYVEADRFLSRLLADKGLLSSKGGLKPCCNPCNCVHGKRYALDRII